MAPPIVRRRLIVHGFVQGVFFRDCTRSCAEGHGVSGWVRNLPDQTVEAVLEGPPDAVQAVADFCARGPQRARVERVESFDEQPEGRAAFEVR